MFRGVLAPIDILPAATAFRSFSGVARTSRLGNGVKELGINIKTGMKNVETKVVQINDAVVTATQQGSMRIKNANAVVKERVKEIPNKLANKAVDAAKVVDETYTNTKTVFSKIGLREELAFDGGVVKQTAENTHTVENLVRNIVGRVPGVNFGGSGAKRSINMTSQMSDEIIRDGSHLLKGGSLKPNVKYQAGEYEYLYQTDDMGRLKEFNADNLKLTERESRLPHNPKTPGKEPGDHAGHLAGDRFGGSPELDNLVSQSSNVNLSKYKKLENQWANAIEEGKDVAVNVKVNYDGVSKRPSSFDIEYEIDGRMRLISIEN